MSRKHWPNHENYKLSTIAATIDHDFHHHHAGDDALACASIALQIFKTNNANSLEELSDILGFSVKYLSKDNPAVIPSNCVPNIPKSEVDKALNRFEKCSDERKCIHSDLIYATACQYRKNLVAGRIFYGRNRNIAY